MNHPMKFDLPVDWEEIPCPWCRSSDYEVLFSGPDRLHGLPGNFYLSRCKQCGLYRQNPRPIWQVLSFYYPEDYAAYSLSNQPKNNIQAWINSYGNVKKRRAIEHWQRSGKLLDIGCGTGSFLEEMSRGEGWEVNGIEPNEYASSIARERLGAPIHTGKFTETEYEPDTFDVITLWCVMEHMEQPIQDLAKINRLIKRNGWLVFSIPNCESLEALRFGRYWAGWDLPRHLFLYPRKLLYEILDHNGFRVVDVKCISMGYVILGHSLEFWSQTWEDNHPLLKKILMNVYRSWLGKTIMLLPLKVLDLLRLGSTLTVFAQKF